MCILFKRNLQLKIAIGFYLQVMVDYKEYILVDTDH